MQMFDVDAVGYKSIAFVFGVVAIPAAIAFLALWAAHGRNYVVAWFVTGFVALVAAGLLAQLFVVRASINGTKLTVGGGLYAVSVDRNNIRKEEIRPLLTEGNLGYRTNGVGMPGLALGWFQPPGGKKIFALVTRGTSILVPTTLGYDVVVSPMDSDRFLAAVKAM